MIVRSLADATAGDRRVVSETRESVRLLLKNDQMGEKRGMLLGAYFAILMRTSALFIGAIGIEMILSGLEGANAVFQRPAAVSA